MSARFDETLGSELWLRGRVTRQHRKAVAQNLLHDRATHVYRLIFPVFAIETEDDAVVERVAAREQNRAALRGHDIEEQFEQTLKQRVESANRVDRRADFHQRPEIASHLIDRVVEPHLKRWATNH